MNRSELSKLLKKHGQEHVLLYYDKLSEHGQVILSEQIEKIDW